MAQAAIVHTAEVVYTLFRLALVDSFIGRNSQKRTPAAQSRASELKAAGLVTCNAILTQLRSSKAEKVKLQPSTYADWACDVSKSEV